MNSKQCRSAGYRAATLASALALAALAGACSSTPELTTGSVPQSSPARQDLSSPPSTAYQQPQTVYERPQLSRPATVAARPVNVASAKAAPRKTCSCRFEKPPYNRDITASIPDTRRLTRTTSGGGYGGEVTGSIPTSRTRPAPVPTAKGNMKLFVHTIARNETLYSISRRYRSSVNDIAYVNRINPSGNLQVGELLIIPKAAN